jgi:hypothetical protein
MIFQKLIADRHCAIVILLHDIIGFAAHKLQSDLRKIMNLEEKIIKYV